MMVRSVVVLPQPLGPSRVRISPRRTSRLSPSTARIGPYDLLTSCSARTAVESVSTRGPASVCTSAMISSSLEPSDQRLFELRLAPCRVLGQVHLRGAHAAALALRAERV